MRKRQPPPEENSEENQLQLDHMVKFIENEGDEKTMEIEAKTEEEYTIEKARLYNIGRQKIVKEYEKKKDVLKVSKKTNTSNLHNKSRIRVLFARDQHVHDFYDDLMDEIAEQLRNDKAKYEKLLTNMILEGLFLIMEKKATVYCRKSDVEMIKSLLPNVAKTFETSTKIPCTLIVSDKSYLGDLSAGGVLITSLNGRIALKNTLESRVEQIMEKYGPRIKQQLFSIVHNDELEKRGSTVKFGGISIQSTDFDDDDD